MKPQPSIIFLIPYFGRWPFWMSFFIESCRANPDIDWLLLGDCGCPIGLPANVRYRYVEFVDYCSWISARLDLRFSPPSPYKLCDLKPALGYLHEQDISGYDFWGFSDLDLIYGDLRAYFTDTRLQRYKVLSTHERRVSGHLCLLRNEQPLRELFWHIPDFKRRVQEPKHHGLDEGGFSRIFLWRKNFPKPLFDLLGLLNPWRRSAEFAEAFSTPNTSRPWLDGTLNFPTSWYWNYGRLMNNIDEGREFPYLHFLGWKKTAWKNLDLSTAQTLRALAKTCQWRVDEKGFHSAERPDAS
jgi:hypothetical protein